MCAAVAPRPGANSTTSAPRRRTCRSMGVVSSAPPGRSTFLPSPASSRWPGRCGECDRALRAAVRTDPLPRDGARDLLPGGTPQVPCTGGDPGARARHRAIGIQGPQHRRSDPGDRAHRVVLRLDAGDHRGHGAGVDRGRAADPGRGDPPAADSTLEPDPRRRGRATLADARRVRRPRAGEDRAADRAGVQPDRRGGGMCAVTADQVPADQVPVDLATRADIEALLRRFYGRVLIDDLLEGPFVPIREKGLESHLPVMGDFWETALFRAGRYRGSALHVHRRVYHRHPFAAPEFLRWLGLWVTTVDEMYRGPIAGRAKVQAARIAWAMHRRLTGADSAELDAVVEAGTRCG